MLATRERQQWAHRRSVPQRPAGQVEEHVLEGRPPDRQVGRLRAQLGGRGQQPADGRRDVGGVQRQAAILVRSPRDTPGSAEQRASSSPGTVSKRTDELMEAARRPAP